MKNKYIKHLIFLLGVVIFSFGIINSVSAAVYMPYCPTCSYEDLVNYADGNNYGQSKFRVLDGSGEVNPRYNYIYIPGFPTSSNSASNSNTQTGPSAPVINNYYYQATGRPITINPSSSSNTSSASVQKEEETDHSDITALSFRGSGSFMPSSIWQWMLVVILILIIIILSRVLIHQHKEKKEPHAVHAH